MNGYNRKQYLYPNPEKWNYLGSYESKVPFSEKLVITAVIIMIAVIAFVFGPQFIGLIF